MRHNALALFLMSALGACSADGVGMDQDIGADAGGGDDVVEDTNLEVDKPDASTYWLSMPMTGHGPAGGTLLYTTPGGGQFTANLGETGDFCVDVVLMKDSTNTIKFEAVNASGDYSDPVLVDVRQSGDAPGTDPSPDPEPGFSNIVSGATIDTMSVNIEEGDVAALVDGDSSGHVSIRNTLTIIPDWMVIELNERLPIQQFHIETTPDCPMESYRILLNDDKQSGDPIVWSWVAGEYVYGAGWTIVGVVGDGTADQTITPSIGDPRAERMAIQFFSSDCGPFIGAGRHNITEIEVWARGDEEPDDGEPSSGAPSCNTF